MKKKSIIIALTALLAGAMLPSTAQSYYMEDDIYYSPKDKNPVVEQKEKEKRATAAIAAATAADAERDVDEYNRRGTTFMYESDEVAPGDTVYVQPEDGYYLDDFNGSLSDYEYTVRIHRFHDPRYVISISDPAYMDIYMLDNNDWNVYIEGPYAWVTPTWTNPWYWNYTWAPYSYSSMAWRWNYAWGASWGYYDPWRWSFGWNYPYYGWSYPYYGWGHPHYGWGHHCHGWHHNDWWYYGNNYKPYGRGPGRHYGNNAPSHNQETSAGRRYGGSFTAGSRQNSTTANSPRHESPTISNVTGRGSRYTIQDSMGETGRRGTSINNSRRGSTGTDVQTGTTVNRRTSPNTGNNSYAPSRSGSRRNSTVSTGRTTINNNSYGRGSVNRRSSSSSSTNRSSYAPSQSNRQPSRSYNNSSRNSSSRSSMSGSRGSSGGNYNSGSRGGSSGGGRGSRR